MNLKGCERELWWHNLRYYPGIYLEGLKKTTRNLSQDGRYPGRNSDDHDDGINDIITISMTMKTMIITWSAALFRSGNSRGACKY
jgi:hypothetical protein